MPTKKRRRSRRSSTRCSSRRTARATFVSVEHAVVRFLIGNEWHVEQEVEPMLGPHLVRRLGVMIGVLPPSADKFAAGRLEMCLGEEKLGFLIRVERDE